MNKTINVTQKDIDNGIKTDCRNCPVVLAIKRTLGIDYGLVDGFSFINYFGRCYPLPANVRAFVDGFDGGYDVTPFEFELDL